MHDLDMQSSVHQRYKRKYHVWNWPAYDRALVQRGDITVWLAPVAIATWEAVGVGTRGGPPQYSDLAIETALPFRLIFQTPLRWPPQGSPEEQGHTNNGRALHFRSRMVQQSGRD